MGWIIFNYMSEGLFSPPWKSHPSFKINTLAQLATMWAEPLSDIMYRTQYFIQRTTSSFVNFRSLVILNLNI